MSNTPRPADDWITDFVIHAIADALTQAQAIHWRRRADEYEQARPRPGDYTGQATPQQTQARDTRLARLAAACRLHAHIIAGGSLDDPAITRDATLYTGRSAA